MTNSKMEALARQLVASPHWRWIPGMHGRYKILSGRIESGVYVGRQHARDGGDMVFQGVFWIRVHKAEPDLSHPATLGCLLQLVRDAWGDVDIYIGRAANGWYPSSRTADMRGVYGYANEVEALVASLLAAPEAA